MLNLMVAHKDMCAPRGPLPFLIEIKLPSVMLFLQSIITIPTLKMYAHTTGTETVDQRNVLNNIIYTTQEVGR